MVAGPPPLGTYLHAISLPISLWSFLPKFGVCSSDAHLENTNVHLTELFSLGGSGRGILSSPRWIKNAYFVL